MCCERQRADLYAISGILPHGIDREYVDEVRSGLSEFCLTKPSTHSTEMLHALHSPASKKEARKRDKIAFMANMEAYEGIYDRFGVLVELFQGE